MTVAWVFPGQGSQKIGMAKQIENLPNTKERFSFASEIFERNLFEICELNTELKNPLMDLNNTSNTQICLFLVESILLDALKENGFKPTYVAGHSLGEITALYCADVFSFEDCVSLIKERSQLMVNAGEGSMAAVIGFDRNQLDLLVQKIEDIKKFRDKSIILIGFGGGFRRTELISIDHEDLEFVPEGLKISIRRSKTDQFGEGMIKGLPYFTNENYCPVVNLKKWLEISKIKSGPIFRRFSKGLSLTEKRLTDQSVVLLMKEYLNLAGIENKKVLINSKLKKIFSSKKNKHLQFL